MSQTKHKQKGETTTGLTIHYSLKAQGTKADARKLIHTLHRTAQDLPFKELGEIADLSGQQCERGPNDVLAPAT